jgi:hypothetical protein
VKKGSAIRQAKPFMAMLHHVLGVVFPEVPANLGFDFLGYAIRPHFQSHFYPASWVSFLAHLKVGGFDERAFTRRLRFTHTMEQRRIYHSRSEGVARFRRGHLLPGAL